MEIHEIDTDLLRNIKNVIYYDLFINLIEQEKEQLFRLVYNLIWIIYIKFNIEYDNFKLLAKKLKKQIDLYYTQYKK